MKKKCFFIFKGQFSLRHRENQRGAILILALWTVVFLSVFAAKVGMRVRQRATVLARLESRSQAHYIAEAGIKKAVAALRADLKQNKGLYSAYGKYYRHNNPDKFKKIEIEDDFSEVSYFHTQQLGDSRKRYGFVDEERKININTADRWTLIRLIQQVAALDEDKAKGIAEAIIDWREIGETRATGFYSDDYYSNLQYPYKPKNMDFEVIDELLLVRGIDEDVYERLRPFVTIYGNGQVNINTASPETLLAIGLDKDLIEKIFLVRRGLDGVEDTVDDYIFYKTYDIASEMKGFVKLKLMEMKRIDYLNDAGMIKTNSFYYQIQSEGILNQKKDIATITCVYNAEEDQVEYWRENYANN